MFFREPMKVPPGAKVTFQVRYHGGRKPFDTRPGADEFAAEQRAKDNGWAAIDQVVTTEVEPRR